MASLGLVILEGSSRFACLALRTFLIYFQVITRRSTSNAPPIAAPAMLPATAPPFRPCDAFGVGDLGVDDGEGTEEAAEGKAEAEE